MGIYWSFFVERHTDQGWELIPPPDWEGKTMPCLYWSRNQFAFFSLFEYPGFFADIHYSWPDDASQELEVYRHSDAFWIPLESLCLDDWTQETLLLKARVPVAVAAIFEQGQKTWEAIYPRLREVMPQKLMFLRQKGRVTPHPQTWYPNQLRNMNPQRLVNITWQETLENVAGSAFMSRIYHEVVLPRKAEVLRLVAIPE